SMLIWAFMGQGSFNNSWQIIFFIGMIAGYYLPEIRTNVEQWPAVRQKRVFRTSLTLATICLVASAIICLYPMMVYDYGRFTIPLFEAFGLTEFKHALAQTLTNWHGNMSVIFSHDRMGVGRILLSLLYF